MFAGVRDSNRVTSSTLTGLKLENVVATGCFLITGGEALEVEAQILSTFDVKKSAEKWLDFWGDGGNIWVRSFDHRAFESPLHESIVEVL